MKNNRGVTLVSLVIYLIVLTMLIGISSLFMKQFYKNTNKYMMTGDTTENYVRLMAYITKDVNSKSFQSINVNSNTITFYFKDGSRHSYTHKENSIYFSQITSSGAEEKVIKICPKVSKANFLYSGRRLETTIHVDNVSYKNVFTV